MFQKELKVFIGEIKKVFNQIPILYVTYDSYKKLIKWDFQEDMLWIRDIIKYPSFEDSHAWGYWQYNDRGRMKGIMGLVDLDVFNGTMLAFSRSFSPALPTPLVK